VAPGRPLLYQSDVLRHPAFWEGAWAIGPTFLTQTR